MFCRKGRQISHCKGQIDTKLIGYVASVTEYPARSSQLTYFLWPFLETLQFSKAAYLHEKSGEGNLTRDLTCASLFLKR